MVEAKESYSVCTDCSAPLAEGEVYGEWDDLCKSCHIERGDADDDEDMEDDIGTCERCGLQDQVVYNADDFGFSSLCEDCRDTVVVYDDAEE